MEDWNPNDFQGRRKEQVEYSTTVVFYSIIGIVLTLILGFILS
jgi:uncharacterized Tic20 family protein